MDVNEHDIIGGYCLDKASSVRVSELQRDIMDALMDHPTLTREQVYEALAGVLHAFALSWAEIIQYTDRDQCEGGLNGAA